MVLVQNCEFCPANSIFNFFSWKKRKRKKKHSYIFMTYENVSGSFETLSCCRNVRTLHELTCVRKVVTRSLPRFLLVHATCRHMRTKRHAVIWTCVRTQETKRDQRSPEQSAFLDSSHDQCGERFTDAKDIAGLGVHATWKSVLLSPHRGCENTFCCLTPGLLTVLHVLLPLLPSFTQHFGSEDAFKKWNFRVFFSPSPTKWAKKNK